MWAGTLPARHVVIIAHHLVLNPRSRVRGLRAESPALQGWTPTTIALARIHNLLLNVVADKDADLSDLYLTPPLGALGAADEGTEEEITFGTIAEFSEAAFGRFIYGKG